ncbi:hypothetical protein [Empedobacter brevis]|uniref:hypothetical protein n=1 Tax=Empedobacter brevis TaxID=247 RepID=UPI00333FA2C8
MLTQQQLVWLSKTENSSTRNSIYNYLNNEGYHEDALMFSVWAIEYLMNNSNYIFNDLLWILNIDFDYLEKEYVMSNPLTVDTANKIMKRNDIDYTTKSTVTGLFIAFETAYENQALNTLHENPLYIYFLNELKKYLSSVSYNATAKIFSLMHTLYWAASKSTEQNKINSWNLLVIDPFRDVVKNNGNINMNTETMSWRDIIMIWLFELVNNNNNNNASREFVLNFGISSNVVKGTSIIEGIKNHNNGNGSVSQARTEVHNKIKGGISNGNESFFWHFNTQALSNFISNPNYMEFTLGSYNTNINWNSIQNSYSINFNIKNITGWNSATRGVQGTFIIPNKERGQGIHLGGTIAETFKWAETYTP